MTRRVALPGDISAIRKELTKILNATDDQWRVVGDVKCGVYAFFDYDNEPIYVGQTQEKMRTRIRRHLTNHRSDAVAMNALDPLEVAYVQMWPLWDLAGKTKQEIQQTLDAAEYTVFKAVREQSRFHATLNEKEIAETQEMELPPRYGGRIMPEDLFKRSQHPDVRIARRADAIARLARVISERQVSLGLRRVLVTQSKRLSALTEKRAAEYEKKPQTPKE